MKAPSVLAFLACCLVNFGTGTRFVCYFPNWTYYREGDGNFKVQNIDPSLCTDLVYAFSTLDANRIISYDPNVDIANRGYADFVALKNKNPKLKTLVAIGGWNDSHNGTKYSDMVASAENRAIFVSSVVDFIKQYNFDGLDLDWEHPMSSTDKEGYSQLLRELRTAFGSKYLLTAAVAANQTIIDLGYDLQAIEETVDYINLMTYDMHGSWESETDHHAPLYKRPEETIENNADFIVNYCLQQGLSAEKINLGIPLYGNSWTLGESTKAEPLALGSGPAPPGPYTGESGMLGYYEICKSIRSDGWEVVNDPDQLNGPYAFSPTSPTAWVGYDDPAMAAIKSQYVLDNKLGGAMVWDMSTDDFRNTCGDGHNPIMKTISDIVVNRGARFVCYFPNWGFYRGTDGKYMVEDIDATLCTDLIYAFAILNGTTNSIEVYDTYADITNQMYAKFVDLKKKNPNIKTTIAIGGWNDSHNGTKYSDMVASLQNRTIFIQSVMAFLENYKFDGLDLDWEYPMSSSDKAGFAELMKELRNAFGTQYLLSVAVAANKTIIDLGYDVATMAETADYINIMAYDMHGPWEPLTDNHAPLYNRSWDTDVTNNVDFIVKYWQTKGLSASQINVGIPLYGKSWTLNYTYTSDPHLPAPGLGPGVAGPLTGQSGFLGYNEICKFVKTANWSVVVDPEYRIGPYASSSEIPMTWVGYDDPSMANVKSRYVLDKKLGGAMVWDISTDDFRNICGDGVNPIISSISRTLLADTSTTVRTSTAPTETGSSTQTSISTSSIGMTSTTLSSSTNAQTTREPTTRKTTISTTAITSTTMTFISSTTVSPGSFSSTINPPKYIWLLVFISILKSLWR